MQIKESFRDSKNRYSLGMAKVNRVGQQCRANLLLIAAWAAFLLLVYRRREKPTDSAIREATDKVGYWEILHSRWLFKRN